MYKRWHVYYCYNEDGYNGRLIDFTVHPQSVRACD